MSDTELVLYCREQHWLLAVAWGAGIAFLIVSVYFGTLYGAGVKIRIPRLRARARRAEGERDASNQERQRLVLELAEARAKIESMGKEAETEIRRVDRIRKKTEDALRDEKDLSASLHAMLGALSAEHIDLH